MLDPAAPQRRAIVSRQAQLRPVAQLTRDTPEERRAYALLDRAQAALRRPDVALALLDEAMALVPRSVPILRLQAQSLQALRRYPDARLAFDRAIETAPADLTLLWQRAHLRRVSGDVTGAIADLEAYAARHPSELAADRARALAASLRGPAPAPPSQDEAPPD